MTGPDTGHRTGQTRADQRRLRSRGPNSITCVLVITLLLDFLFICFCCIEARSHLWICLSVCLSEPQRSSVSQHNGMCKSFKWLSTIDQLLVFNGFCQIPLLVFNGFCQISLLVFNGFCTIEPLLVFNGFVQLNHCWFSKVFVQLNYCWFSMIFVKCHCLFSMVLYN